VVVYTSLDRPYAEPVLREFERQSGLRVRDVYDTEATKSLGLATRVASERGRPRADVFWSSEVIRVIGLQEQGLLAAYRSPNAEGIPMRFKDADGFWTGFAARARVIVYNTKFVRQPPRSRFDFEKPEWRGAVAMANPLFGTTATEAAALFELLGPEKARAHFRALAANGLRIVNGNSVAADWTARGEVRAALTDTDDALTRMRGGAHLAMVYPDQESGDGDALGTLVIPNTVALVRDGPNAENGRRLIDHLLSPAVEAALATGDARQMPLRSGVETSSDTPRLAQLRAFDVDFARVAKQSGTVDAFLKGLFQQ